MITGGEGEHIGDKTNKIAKLEVISGHSAILHFAGRHLPAAIGRNGVSVNKHEGDECTPPGLLSIRRIFYRSDRVDQPHTSFTCTPINENDGWCDDAAHQDYNRHICLPHPASHERLWLENRLYDIIGVLGYNDDPIVPGRGSAIFLHIASRNMTPTQGCIALSLDDLQWALEQGLEAIFVPS